MSDDATPTDRAGADAPPPIDSDRLARGAATFDAVYGGLMSAPPPGSLEFSDVMLAQLFAEHWARPQLDVRARRLATLGAIAALGEPGAWSIHVEAALRNDELTATEARELVLHLSQYAGYARVSPLLLATEEAIARADRAGT